MTDTEATPGDNPRRRRLAVLLLLFFVGGAGGVVTAVAIRDERPARPSAGGEQPGTGTVIGGTGATPSPSPGGTGSPEEPAATPGTDIPRVPNGTVAPDPGTTDPDDPQVPPALGVFYISGHAPGLVPGRPVRLNLTVTNPNAWPIQVLTIDTRVVDPVATTCPPGMITVSRYEDTTGEKLTAPALGTVVVPVTIEFADSATQDQSGCAGLTFPLTMTGTAARVG